MRIVGGKYRSRLIDWPDDTTRIRPTKDRIREAIFNAVGDITDYVALDLYAGSGAMGLEALSHYAKMAYFVDINPIALKTIKKNIESLSIDPNEAKVLSMPDVEALSFLEKQSNKLDIIFIDPPYAEGKYQEIVSLLESKNLLSENAIIVLEANREIVVDSTEYRKRRDYKYGEIYVAILWR